MTLDLGGVSLAFGPTSRGAPDDIWTEITSVLQQSWAELMVLSQKLSDPRVVNAIIRVSDRRALRVRVLLEEEYLFESSAQRRPWRGSGDNEASRAAFAALARSAVRVRLDRSGGLQHGNCLLARGDQTHPSASLVSSANWTRSNLMAHFNASVAIRGETISEMLKSYFDSAWLNVVAAPFTASAPTGDGGTCTAVAGGSGVVPRSMIEQIDAAVATIDLAIFNVAVGSRGIDALARAIARGVGVRGVVDGDQRGLPWDGVPTLRAAGADIRYVPGVLSGGEGRMHHKTLLVDDANVVVSTANLSAAAESAQELLVVLVPGQATTPWVAAEYVKAELDRLFSLGQVP